jgi:hypothetical protein
MSGHLRIRAAWFPQTNATTDQSLDTFDFNVQPSLD